MVKKIIQPDSNQEPESPENESIAITPPYDRKVEEATIGCVLIDPDCYIELKGILKPADFYKRRLGWLWQAFENIQDRGEPLDFITIESELTRMGRLEEIGGMPYLTSLLNTSPTSLHALTYSQAVKEFAIKRRMIEAANEIATLAYSPRSTAEQTVTRALEIIQDNTTGTNKRYVVNNASDALAPEEPVKWIVDGLIYDKSVTVLYGEGGAKKTYAAMFLAACVASGSNWGDYKTHKTRVLFIDEENGDSEMHRRAGECLRGALANETADLRYISLAAFHLDDRLDESILTNEIIAQGAGLVIFDSFTEIMTGDENSKQDTQPVFSALRRIVAKTGCAIIIIHHSNKQSGFRGSTVIKNAPDIFIRIDSDLDSNYVNFYVEKNRRDKATKWAMEATWSAGQFYLRSVDQPEKPKTMGKAQTFVIDYLTEHGQSDVNSITGSADTCSAAAARSALYSLASQGFIKRINPSDSDRTPAIYDLVKK